MLDHHGRTDASSFPPILAGQTRSRVLRLGASCIAAFDPGSDGRCADLMHPVAVALEQGDGGLDALLVCHSSFATFSLCPAQ